MKSLSRILVAGVALWCCAPVWAQPNAGGTVYRQTQTFRPGDGPVANAFLIGGNYALQVGDRAVRGLDAVTEQVRWTLEPPAGRISHTREVFGSLIVQASDLHSVDPASGEIRWTYPLQCPTALNCKEQLLDWGDAFAVIAGRDGKRDRVNLLDLRRGEMRWREWAPVPPAQHALAVGNTIVVVGAEVPHPVVGLDARSGEERWRLAGGLDGMVVEEVSAEGGNAYFWALGSAGAKVFAVAANSGSVLGRVAVGEGRVRARPDGAIQAGWSKVVSGRLLSWSRRGEVDTLTVRQLPDGTMLWANPMKLTRRPVVVGALMIVAVADQGTHRVEVLDLATGERRLALPRRGEVRGLSAWMVGTQVQVGVSGAGATLYGLRARDGALLSLGLPDAPAHAPIEGVGGDEQTLLTVVGGSLYRLQANTVQAIEAQLREHLKGGKEGPARELFAGVHDLVGALPSAHRLTQLMTNHDLLMVESSITSEDWSGAASRIREATNEDRLRYAADVAAFFDAASDLLTRKLHEVGPILDARAAARQEFLRAFSDAAQRGLAVSEALKADPSMAGRVQSGWSRLAHWMVLRGEAQIALQLLGGLANAEWLQSKDDLDTYRGAALLGTARTMLRDARDEYKKRNYVESWAIFRDVVQLPGVALMVPSGREIASAVPALDPEDRRGRAELNRLLRRFDKELAGKPERGWNATTCALECRLAHETCATRPCAAQRHCDDDRRACSRSCQLGTPAPSWPRTQPATLGSPEWWQCR